MYKDVISATIWFDEAKSFGCIKPFHGATWHFPRLLLLICCSGVTQRISGFVTVRDPFLIMAGLKAGHTGADLYVVPAATVACVRNKSSGYAFSSIDCVWRQAEEGKFMILYGLKNCDTCRKALKQLPDARLVDVRGEGVPTEVLTEALAQFGDKLVNTRSTTWRGLSEEERAGAPLNLLQQHPALMKRPLIQTVDGLFLGWDKATQAALLPV
jgi:arsenate reductase